MMSDGDCHTDETALSTQCSTQSDELYQQQRHQLELQLGPDGDMISHYEQDLSAKDVQHALGQRGVRLLAADESLSGTFSQSAAHPGRDGCGHIVVAKASSWLSIELALLQMARTAERQGEEHGLLRLLMDEVAIGQEASMLIVTEHCTHGDLASLLARLRPSPPSLSVVVRIVHGLACAIDFLHVRRVVHRAIRLHHVLIDAGCVVRLCGLSKAMHCPDPGGIDRTALINDDSAYLAPEWTTPTTTCVDPFSVDMFAVGVVLYRLLMGCMPIRRTAIVRTIDSRPPWTQPQELVKTMELLLSRKVQLRPTAAMLKHSDWLRSVMNDSKLWSLLDVDSLLSSLSCRRPFSSDG